jgi:hypothetical protein
MAAERPPATLRRNVSSVALKLSVCPMRRLVLTPLLFAFSIRGRHYGPVGVPGAGSRVLFSNLQPIVISLLSSLFVH